MLYPLYGNIAYVI